jgi:dolichol-phosphate mannosyltransferase
MHKPEVTLSIIVRNEMSCLEQMVPLIPFDMFHDVVIVDGNSTDGTFEYFEEMKIANSKVVRQVEPGLGAAMFLAVEEAEGDAVIFFHPDGNENPEDLEKMKNILIDGAEFVVASRMCAGAVNEDDKKILRWRKWGNLFFVAIANLAFSSKGNKTTDVTNGFRGITKTSWHEMELTSKDLTMDYQMIIKALRKGIRIFEFPTVEGERVDGQTTFASIPTGLAELRLFVSELKDHWSRDNG